MGRLRPENFEAVLDLTGISGEFSRELVIIAPQGITVDEVSPAEASGTVETITSKVVPVEVALLGPHAQDAGGVDRRVGASDQHVVAIADADIDSSQPITTLRPKLAQFDADFAEARRTFDAACG